MSCPILRGNLIGGALGAKHECARPPFYEETPMNETKDPAIDNWMKISRNVRSSCQLNCSIFKEPDADVPFFTDISWFVEFKEYFWGGHFCSDYWY